MQKMLKSLAFAAVAVLVMSSCASLKVTTDYDHAKDFSKIKTFAMHSNTTDNATISQLNQGRILAAVRNALVAKGYTEVQSNPDFLINVNAIVKDQKAVTANTDYYNYYNYGGLYRPYAYWGPGMGMGNATTTFNVEDYQNGSLIIDIVDARTQKLFWEGIGNSDIASNFAEKAEQHIIDAVNKILASFPNVGLQPAVKK